MTSTLRHPFERLPLDKEQFLPIQPRAACANGSRPSRLYFNDMRPDLNPKVSVALVLEVWECFRAAAGKLRLAEKKPPRKTQITDPRR